MSTHELDEIKAYLDQRMTPLEKQVAGMEDKVNTMYDVFTAGKISSGVLRFSLWFVSIVLGILLAIKELTRK